MAGSRARWWIWQPKTPAFRSGDLPGRAAPSESDRPVEEKARWPIWSRLSRGSISSRPWARGLRERDIIDEELTDPAACIVTAPSCTAAACSPHFKEELGGGVWLESSSRYAAVRTGVRLGAEASLVLW